MRLGKLIAILVLATGLAAGPAALAQQPPASEQSADRLHQELAGIQQQLAAIEARAMQDPAIEKAAEKLDADVERAMEKADPKFDAKIARLDEIVKELEAKVQAGVPEGELMPLVAEGQGIQRDLQQTQVKVLESEPISSQVGAFHERVQAKMAEIDPNTRELVKRAEAILQELESRAGAKPGA